MVSFISKESTLYSNEPKEIAFINNEMEELL